MDVDDFIKRVYPGEKNASYSFLQDGCVVLIFLESKVVKMHHHTMHDYHCDYEISMPNGVCECSSFEYISGIVKERGLLNIIRPAYRTFAVCLGEEYRVCIEMERFGISLYDWMCVVPEKDMVFTQDFDIEIPDSILIKGGMNKLFSQSDATAEAMDLVNSFLKGIIFQVVGGISQLYRHTRFVHGDLHSRQVLFLRRGGGSIYSNRNYTIQKEEYTLVRERFPSVCIIDLEHCTYVRDGVEYSGHVDGYCNTVDGSYDLYRFCSSLLHYSCITMSHVWPHICPQIKSFLLKHAKIQADLCGKSSHPIQPPPSWALFTPHMIKCESSEMAMRSKLFDIFRGQSALCSLNCVETTRVPEDIEWTRMCELYLGKNVSGIPDYETVIKGLFSMVDIDLDDKSFKSINHIVIEICNKTIRFIDNTLAHVYTGSSLEFAFAYMWLEMVRSQQAVRLFLNHMKAMKASNLTHSELRGMAHIFQGYIRHRWINNAWDSVAIKNDIDQTCTYSTSEPKLDITRGEMDIWIESIKAYNSFRVCNYLECATPIHTCNFMSFDKTKEDINTKMQKLKRCFSYQMNIKSFVKPKTSLWV